MRSEKLDNPNALVDSHTIPHLIKDISINEQQRQRDVQCGRIAEIGDLPIEYVNQMVYGYNYSPE